MSTSTIERVELSVGGEKMHAHVARPAKAVANGPGIIVFQEAFGVNDHVRSLASRFADLGLTAIAPELYHRTGHGNEFDYDVPREARAKHSAAVTVEGIVADATAAYEWLTKEAKVAPARVSCTGYCMGGRASYIANAHLPFAGAVSYYGGGCDALPELASKQHAPILMFWGGLDKGILAENLHATEAALTRAGKPHAQVLFSYADHGFFCDARASYSAGAARQAWALHLEYLRVHNVLD